MDLEITPYELEGIKVSLDLVLAGMKIFSISLVSFMRLMMLLSFMYLQHGFARNMNWSVVDSESAEGKPVVTFELKDTTYSRSMWDFSFQALYKVCFAAFSAW